MTVRAILAAVVAVTVVAGCGGGGERKSVSEYITNVNKIEQQMRGPLNQMVRTYARFSTKAKLRTVGPRLERGQKILEALNRRLATLDPPPAAKKLHSMMLQLVGGEIDLAGEIAHLALFLPAFETVISKLGPANTHLAVALAASPTPKPKAVRGTKKQIARLQADFIRRFTKAAAAQAAAIEAYRADLAVLIRELSALKPPAVLAPSFRSELALLDGLRSTGESLAQALRVGRYSELPTLNRRFTAAARISRTVSAQQAQIGAIQQYNGRIRSLNKLARSIQREETRLERTLG